MRRESFCNNRIKFVIIVPHSSQVLFLGVWELLEFIVDKTFVHAVLTSCISRFTKLCADAYLILRKRGYLFITLFAMMLQTGKWLSLIHI